MSKIQSRRLTVWLQSNEYEYLTYKHPDELREYLKILHRGDR